MTFDTGAVVKKKKIRGTLEDILIRTVIIVMQQDFTDTSADLQDCVLYLKVSHICRRHDTDLAKKS